MASKCLIESPGYRSTQPNGFRSPKQLRGAFASPSYGWKYITGDTFQVCSAPWGRTYVLILCNSLNIISDAFKSKMQPARHRMVYALLKDELERPGGIHALQLRTKTSEEEEKLQARAEAEAGQPFAEVSKE